MPSSSPRRIILVGCGAIARQLYVPALRALQEAGVARVSAIVDPAVTAREAIAQTFPRAGQSAALEQTTAPANSLVILTSPTRFRAAQAMVALEKGWHVFCENPVGSTVAETADAIAAAQRHQRLLAVNLYQRFFPACRYLRSLCRDWLLGPLVSYTINEGGSFRAADDAANFDRAQEPGGVLFETGPNVFDLLGWCLGEPSNIRYADDAMGGLEANAFVQLDYANGPRGRVHLSRDCLPAQEYCFVFERGVVTWRGNDAGHLAVELAGAPAVLRGSLLSLHGESLSSADPLETVPQCFLLQLQNVLAAIAGEETLLAPAEEAQSSLRLIEQCYAHRALVDQPWLTPDEAARAHELGSAVATTS
jgi:predicted dehydrogenase